MPKQYVTTAKVRKPTRISLEIYPDCESAPLNPKVPPITSQKVLFLWMPKVAGMSISRALSSAYGPRYRALENKPQDFSLDLTSVTFYHSHVPSLVQKGFISQQWVDDSFKFAFVRNPWDRLVSLYHWLGLKKELDFDTYINRVVSGNYERPGLTNIRGLYQANRLVDWLRPKGLWLPDYIGKFETLNEDWTNIQHILSIKAPLAHTNQSIHKPYKIYYNIHTQRLVAKRFEEDIDLFKYTF
jgi:chondroitin 4-sulfotransferase 11